MLKSYKKTGYALFIAAICIMVLDLPVYGADILLGQSCALSGPAKELGIDMRAGAIAYFNFINTRGGINGKKIKLISYDDGYEPNRCIANTRRLINKDKVFLLFGYVGTPTSKVAVPVAVQNKVPYFAPFTGAEFLRSPVIKYIFNIRASYFMETEIMVERLTKDLGIKKIAVFYQNDSYGKAGLEGVRRALAKRNLVVVAKGSYPRNTLSVDTALKAILQENPEAIILIGAYQPCAAFIKKARKAGSLAVMLNVSFVSGEALAFYLKNFGLGTVVTQVVPYPYDTCLSVVKEFHRLMAKYSRKEKINFVSLEGFIAAKALCKILKETTPLTRERFIETAESTKNLDLGGFTISFSRNDHQGSDLVYLTQIAPGGYLTPIDDLNYLYE